MISSRSLKRAVKHSVPTPLALVLNFPSNPTAQVVDLDFYREMRRVLPPARHLDPVRPRLCRDLFRRHAAALDPGGARAPRTSPSSSRSMCKTYSMPGWRIGFAAGNRTLIGALARIKSYLDYGAFTPVQVAATAALNGPQDCVEEMRELYRERRDVLIDGLAAGRLARAEPAGLDVRLGADPGALRAISARWSSPSCCWRRPRSRSRRASASASTATAMCAWRWSRTCSASARRCATSAPSSTRTPIAARAADAEARRGQAAARRDADAAADRHRRPRHGRRRRAASCSPSNAELLAARAAGGSSSTAVCARDRARDRGVDLAGVALVRRCRRRWPREPDVDVVVELIGGGDGAASARSRRRSPRGRPVVTANKALLAHHGRRSRAWPRRRASRSPSRRRSPAASRSSRRCARGSPPTGSRASTASSTAPATTS